MLSTFLGLALVSPGSAVSPTLMFDHRGFLMLDKGHGEGKQYVCYDGFNDEAARMACRSMGYGRALYYQKGLAGDPQGHDPRVISRVECPRGASKASECDFETSNERICPKFGTVGLECSEEPNVWYKPRCRGSCTVDDCKRVNLGYPGDCSGCEWCKWVGSRRLEAASASPVPYPSASPIPAGDDVGPEDGGYDPKFDIGTCDQLELTRGGNCVGTTAYGEDHECEFTALGSFTLDVTRWDSPNLPLVPFTCSYENLQFPNGKKYCTHPPDMEVVSKGDKLTWKTEFHTSTHQWEICAGTSAPGRRRSEDAVSPKKAEDSPKVEDSSTCSWFVNCDLPEEVAPDEPVVGCCIPFFKCTFVKEGINVCAPAQPFPFRRLLD